MQMYKVKLNKGGYLKFKHNKKVAQYTRGEAIKKARMFDGKIEKGMISEQGTCPKCEKQNLDYGAQDLQDDSIIYPYECPDCKFLGKEWFKLSFQCHTDSTGNEL